MKPPPQKRKLPGLTIFLPAYNEAENIGTTVKKAVEVAQQITENHNFEVIVINDGSTDDTADVVRTLTQRFPKVRLINHPQNMGYGAALMTGFKNATKEWVFFTDGDGQFDISELTKFLPYQDQEPVMIGFRIKRNDSWLRLMNAKGWNILNRLAFGLRVQDIDCAFKLIRKDALNKVLPQMNSVGAMISAELLLRLQHAGYSFKEIGVHHYPRTAGSPTGALPTLIPRAPQTHA